MHLLLSYNFVLGEQVKQSMLDWCFGTWGWGLISAGQAVRNREGWEVGERPTRTYIDVFRPPRACWDAHPSLTTSSPP